jgi:hypothetical protein
MESLKVNKETMMTVVNTSNIERTALQSAAAIDQQTTASLGQVKVRVIKGDSKKVDQSIFVRVN